MSTTATASVRPPETTVEDLRERIASLVAGRQQLRAAGACRAALERNRVELARSQWELGHALIRRHLPSLAYG
jgi:hypothetical protein